jgi:hypothetical protein
MRRKISPSIPVSLDRNEAATYDPGDPITIRATVSCPVHIRLSYVVRGVRDQAEDWG